MCIVIVQQICVKRCFTQYNLNNYPHLEISFHTHELNKLFSELNLVGTEYVSLMGTIHLKCNATGSTTAPDGVDWFFQGQPIHDNNKSWDGRLVELNSKPVPGRTLISELIIKNVQMADGGHYVCRLTKNLAEGFKVHVLNGKYE